MRSQFTKLLHSQEPIARERKKKIPEVNFLKQRNLSFLLSLCPAHKLPHQFRNLRLDHRVIMEEAKGTHKLNLKG
jgi:hypothetical protein